MIKNKMGVKEGVYACFTGTSFESAAEIKMAKISGCDVAGMSTVPEAIAANHMGIKVAGISCISNMATGVAKGPFT
jgi:purine-nucleoside phosphorylase